MSPRISRLLFPALLTAAAVLVVHPPRPSAQGGGVAVSADSILAVARHLSGATGGPPSRFGVLPSTAGYAEYLRDRLARALAPLDGEVSFDPFDPAFTTMGGDSVRSPYTNVTGIIRGSRAGDRAGFYLFGAHFDATAQRDEGFAAGWRTHPAPGADDNASGVSTVLEAARVFAARGARPDLSVAFVFFDGEEQQVPETDRFLLGSTRLASVRLDSLVAALGPLHGVVNADMVAYNPRVDSLVVLANLPSRWLANRFTDLHGSAGAAPGLLLSRVVQGLTYSDHAPFWERGVPAVLLIEAASIQEHAPHYHKAVDTVDNTYLRGGSQARRASELMLALLETFVSSAGSESLFVETDDILVRRGRAVDLPVIDAGTEVEVAVGVVNRGATRTQPWTASVVVEVDGRTTRLLPEMEGPVPFAAGARAELRFPWTPSADEIGAPELVAVVDASGAPSAVREASRRVAVRGPAADLVRAWVYPNPTRLAARALLHWELSRPGSIRATLLDLAGRGIDEADLPYDAGPVTPGTQVGANELALESLFPSAASLAPGVYLIRLELFDDGASVAVKLVKWAVLR